MPGIYSEVHEHLLDLSRIRLDSPMLGTTKCHKLDVFADHTTQHTIHVGDQAVQVEDPGPKDLLPAEGQQLMREQRGLFRSLLDGFGVAADWLVGAALPEHHLRIAHDCGEPVAKVVGDPYGQPAHGVKLLGLAQLLFQSPTLDHMTQFGADVGHRLKEARVRRARLAAEKLKDADHVGTGKTGKASASLHRYLGLSGIERIQDPW